MTRFICTQRISLIKGLPFCPLTEYIHKATVIVIASQCILHTLLAHMLALQPSAKCWICHGFPMSNITILIWECTNACMMHNLNMGMHKCLYDAQHCWRECSPSVSCWVCVSVSFKDCGKPWFHVTPQSGNLRNCVLMFFSYLPQPAGRPGAFRRLVLRKSTVGCEEAFAVTWKGLFEFASWPNCPF